jgi:hypothetical protein
VISCIWAAAAEVVIVFAGAGLGFAGCGNTGGNRSAMVLVTEWCGYSEDSVVRGASRGCSAARIASSGTSGRVLPGRRICGKWPRASFRLKVESEQFHRRLRSLSGSASRVSSDADIHGRRKCQSAGKVMQWLPSARKLATACHWHFTGQPSEWSGNSPECRFLGVGWAATAFSGFGRLRDTVDG